MHKKNLSLLTVAGMLSLFLVSCSSISVTSDYDKTVNLGKCRTAHN
jgi:hypothetical protein